MRINISKATPLQLNYLVASLENLGARYNNEIPLYAVVNMSKYRPCSNWMQAGPIIEREKIDLQWDVRRSHPEGIWICLIGCQDEVYGPTPLIAAMRCYCLSKLGDTADVPETLK